eukprot:scaffold3169_cov116-Isochrysis_galbana.AAC.1
MGEAGSGVGLERVGCGELRASLHTRARRQTSAAGTVLGRAQNRYRCLFFAGRREKVRVTIWGSRACAAPPPVQAPRARASLSSRGPPPAAPPAACPARPPPSQPQPQPGGGGGEGSVFLRGQG